MNPEILTVQDSDNSDLEDEDTTPEIFSAYDSEEEKEMEQSLEDIGKVPKVPSKVDQK